MNNQGLFHKWIPFNGSTKDPVVFIHGFLETHTIWYGLSLQQIERPILLLDVSGFGKSPLLDDHHPSIDYFSSEVIALLQTYQVDNYDIVGHSMGGYIGLELLKKDHQAKKLILLNSNFWEDSDLKKKERTRVADVLLKSKNLFISEAIPNLFVHPEQHPTIVQELINEAKNGVAEWYAYATLAMRERADFSSFLKQNPDSFEIIHGENDALIPTQAMEEKCNGWKDFHTVKDSGHMSLFEQPKEVIALLKKLLS